MFQISISSVEEQKSVVEFLMTLGYRVHGTWGNDYYKDRSIPFDGFPPTEYPSVGGGSGGCLWFGTCPEGEKGIPLSVYNLANRRSHV